MALTYFGILIALNTAFWSYINKLSTFILFNVVAILLCIITDWLEKKIRDSQYNFIECILYFFTKDNKFYDIESRIETYNIISDNQAKFTSIANVKVKHSPESFEYMDRFHWEQDTDIDVKTNDVNRYTCLLTDDLNWTKISIRPSNFVPNKNQVLNVGYTLNDLVIPNLSKRSFLSCKPTDKIRTLKLVAEVAPHLSPKQEGVFIIQNKYGEEIHSEKLLYNAATNTYEKTIKYPRKTRKYIIKWYY